MIERLEPINWNERWGHAVARKWPSIDNRSRYWDQRAPSFAARSLSSPYTTGFLKVLAPKPEWSILDVGCGVGALAIPLASHVKQVTAIDFSEAMIEHLDRRCQAMGIANIRTSHTGWEDDWDEAGIGTHDVAIASRSLVVNDLETAIRKLDKAARTRVLIASPAGDGPMDRRALEAVGRPFQKGPDYIYVYNILHEMGIYAHVSILHSEEERTFGNPEEALAIYRTLIDNLTPEEDARLIAYLSQELILRKGVWALRHPNPTQWALIWWEKETVR